MRITVGRLVRRAVSCGCRIHQGEHRGCEDACWDFGCTQSIGYQRTQWRWER